ncbi:MAG: LPS export ABC transporter ATP-binding protein [Candidatus Brocadiales bacterium]
MKLLDVVRLTKIYGKRVVLNSLDLEVNSGEIVGLLGHNGAGKSTAFNGIIGITSPDGGRVIFRGRDITKLPIYKRARMGLGYLCQEPSVFQRLTVEENILAILEARKHNRQERHKRSARLMDDFGLTYLAKKKAFTLSGGEKRRLEIARCLATDPVLIMLDEPFSGIDPIAVAELQAMVLGLRNRGIGILVTDHNVREALSITDRSYILNQGVVITKGNTPEIINDPLAIECYLGEGFTVEKKSPQPAVFGGQVRQEMPKEPPVKRLKIV